MWRGRKCPVALICMMGSQKIEVGHTLKSKNVGFSNRQKPVQHTVLYYVSKSRRGFAQIVCGQLQFFDNLVHNFVAKGLKESH